MELTLITLAAEAPLAAAPDGARVAELLRAVSRPADRLEHVSTQAAPGHLHLGIFTAAGAGETAGTTALDLCHRALAASLLLRGWRVAAARFES